MEIRKEACGQKVEVGNAEIPGLTLMKDGANFVIAVPDEKEAFLLLYQKDDKEMNVSKRIKLPLENREGDLCAVFLPGFESEKYDYNYEIDHKIMLDPYAKKICGREKYGELVLLDALPKIRCAAEEKSINWENDVPLKISYEESIVYKIHVRGFSKQKNSKVRHKGTFKGIQEKIPYLKQLGITAIELMPAYEFEEMEIPKIGAYTSYGQNIEDIKPNYWGYTKGSYFAPKASYCAGKNHKQEVQNLVKELHKNGIECIMEFYFPQGIVPKTALDALHYWRKEYHMDGFHLLGDGVPVELIVRDPILTGTKLWFPNVDSKWIYGDRVPKYRNIAAYNQGFQNDIRRLLKGDEDQLNSFIYRSKENPATHGVLNYLTNTDGFTLMDLVSYEKKHNEENGEDNRDGNNYNYAWNCGQEGPSRKISVRKIRLQQMKNAFLLMLFSQGTPLLLGGDEFGNSQNGNNNAYCQDNPIGWLDWEVAKKNEGLTKFVMRAVAFRKEHSMLHMSSQLRMMDYLANGYPDLSYHSERAWYMQVDNSSRYIGMMLCGDYAKAKNRGADDYLYIAYNFHWDAHEFALPKLPKEKKWHITIDTSQAEGFLEESKCIEKDDKSLVVQPRSIVVLLGK